MALTAEQKGKGRAAPSWLDQRADVWQTLDANKTAVSATVGSLTSTLLGFPMDTLKARLQTTRGVAPGIGRLAVDIWKEEGLLGFFRGCAIPLVSIAVVRTTSFSIYTSTKNDLTRRGTFGPLMASFVSGCCTGAILTLGSTPFELIKIRRQLETMISKEMGILNAAPMNARQCVASIVKTRGVLGLYTGFRPHLARDLLGTGFYFALYDWLRQLMGRRADGTQGQTPAWSPIPASLTPLVSGAVAGVSAFACVYPIDAVKTNMQKRALSNQSYRSPLQTLKILLEGHDPSRPLPLLQGFARLYRGLGVSAARSCCTHGILWLVVDNVQTFIEQHRASSAALAEGL